MKISRKHGQARLFVVRGRRNDIIWGRTNNTTLSLFQSTGSLFKTDRFTLQEDCWTCWSDDLVSIKVALFSIWDLYPQRRKKKSKIQVQSCPVSWSNFKQLIGYIFYILYFILYFIYYQKCIITTHCIAAYLLNFHTSESSPLLPTLNTIVKYHSTYKFCKFTFLITLSIMWSPPPVLVCRQVSFLAGIPMHHCSYVVMLLFVITVQSSCNS